MALVKNLSTEAEENYKKNFFGKFNAFNDVVGMSTFLQKIITVDDSHVPLTNKDFLKIMYGRSNFQSLPYKIVKHNDSTYVVYIPRFLTDNRKYSVVVKPEESHVLPPYYSDETVTFTSIIEALPKVPKVFVAANGNQVFKDISIAYINSGLVFKGGVNQFPNSSQAAGGDQMAIQYDSGTSPSFTFRRMGEPDGGDGLGGLTPVLFKNNQGEQFVFGAVAADATDTSPKITFNPFYKQLLHTNSVGDTPRDGDGKHIFAYKRGSTSLVTSDIALIIINENGIAPGVKIDEIRDALYKLGFEYAMGMDGSDSVFLYERGGKPEFIISPESKDNAGTLDPDKNHWILRTGYAITK